MPGITTAPDPTATAALNDLLPGYDRQDRDARRAVRIAHAARFGDGVNREL